MTIRNVIRIGSKLPSPIRKVGRQAFIKFTRLTNRNHVQYEYDGRTFTYRYHDIPTLRKLSDCIRNGKVTHEGINIDHFCIEDKYDGIIDIGAHFGIYSVLLGVLNPDTPIYCFEPNEYNRTVLENNLIINSLKNERVKVRNEVVGGESEIVIFYEDPTELGTVSHTANPSEKHSGHVRVEKEGIAISELLEEEGLQQPWIKIDAEGAEYEILQDALECNYIQEIGGFLELHLNRDGITIERFDQLLEDHGYTWTNVKESTGNPGYIFWKDPQND